MSSPVCEILLLFNPRYMNQPENEFLDGFVATYSSAGNPKAKGLDFTISYPMSWTAKEGNRPNVVQTFGSVHRDGYTDLMVIVKNIPEFNELNLSQEDWVQLVNETASTGDFSSFLPAGATLIAGEKVVLETLPGFFLHCNNTIQRGRHSLTIESTMYMLFYKDRGVIIQANSVLNVDNEDVHHGSLEKNAKLLELMVNSFVLNNLW